MRDGSEEASNRRGFPSAATDERLSGALELLQVRASG
jgi:hypothetical protein